MCASLDMPVYTIRGYFDHFCLLHCHAIQAISRDIFYRILCSAARILTLAMIETFARHRPNKTFSGQAVPRNVHLLIAPHSQTGQNRRYPKRSITRKDRQEPILSQKSYTSFLESSIGLYRSALNWMLSLSTLSPNVEKFSRPGVMPSGAPKIRMRTRLARTASMG